MDQKRRLQEAADVEESLFDSLPASILAEILSWLPAKMVFRCKLVSKTWLSVVSDKSFAKTHFSRSRVCPLLDFSQPFSGRPNRIFHLVEGESVSDLDPQSGNSLMRTRVEFPDPKDGWSRSFISFQNLLPTSCEGLVCWATSNGEGDIFICNPVTGEYVILNHLPRDRRSQKREDEGFLLIGLGFSRVTKKFVLLKVVFKRITCNGNESLLHWWPQICTVGNKCWRRVGGATSTPELKYYGAVIEDVIYINGAMYWRFLFRTYICCFDFDREIFQVIPLPERSNVTLETNSFGTMHTGLGVLGDTPCVSMISPDYGHIEFWVMKKDDAASQVSLTKLYNVDTEAILSGCRRNLLLAGCYEALKYVYHVEIGMHGRHATCVEYDPTTKAESFFGLLENSHLEDVDNCFTSQVIHHVPSLISLQDSLNMEDKSVTIMRTYSRRLTRRRASTSTVTS